MTLLSILGAPCRALGLGASIAANHLRTSYASIVVAAKRILADSQLRISEVALAVGYQDADYFSRCFKAELGCSPRAFRREVEEDNGGDSR